ncbi:hypothetical protein ATANTOWER_010629 [Ataeniobius toweri]|uniref:Uncharacterized protein n=1 Tax=Ataeniobius toweri TaxID=208326 RepID=A0ABU7AGJ9_9TELE|nr:hypothetical protein [Ataeniobius toweri]
MQNDLELIKIDIIFFLGVTLKSQVSDLHLSHKNKYVGLDHTCTSLELKSSMQFSSYVFRSESKSLWKLQNTALNVNALQAYILLRKDALGLLAIDVCGQWALNGLQNLFV